MRTIERFTCGCGHNSRTWAISNWHTSCGSTSLLPNTPLTVDCWLLCTNHLHAMSSNTSPRTCSGFAKLCNHGPFAGAFLSPAQVCHFHNLCFWVLSPTDPNAKVSIPRSTSSLFPDPARATRGGVGGQFVGRGVPVRVTAFASLAPCVPSSMRFHKVSSWPLTTHFVPCTT